MEDSIFTKIIKGEIPSHKIYEDDKTLAFMNIYPSVEGHVLVIPKVQVPYLWDLDESDYIAVTLTAKKVALRLKQVLGTDFVGQKVIGLDVPHAHIHLIPFSTAAQFHAAETSDEPDHQQLAALAERLAFN